MVKRSIVIASNRLFGTNEKSIRLPLPVLGTRLRKVFWAYGNSLDEGPLG